MEQNATVISGLRYLQAYLSSEEHDRFLATVDQQPWLTSLKRRVQHYGYRYDYKSRSMDSSMFLGALPDWLSELADRLHREGWVACVPDQVIINEYEPGQGISAHVDCEPCFGETVLSVTLGSSCLMVFSSQRSEEQVSLLVEPRSLVVMGAMHAITGSMPSRRAKRTCTPAEPLSVSGVSL